MVAVKLENFGGMIPAVDDRLLPTANAAFCRNTWLYSGAIRGISTPQELYTLQNATTKRIYRIPIDYYDKSHLAASYWMEFDHIDTDVVHSPVVNDSFSRYYWASPTDVPRYNTFDNIITGSGYLGSNGYALGIPAPPTAPSVSPTGGVSGTNRTSAYVYTWVSAYGEEGPPSPPTVTTGKVDDTWGITVSAIGALATGRNITHTRIYRTITSSAGVATYFFVAELAIATLSYNDTATDDTVAGNNQLESTTWTAPPEDLKGMATMPNGMIVGFRENEIWFCQPYRPHAWPSTYTVSVEHPIVGLGVIGQTVIVLTTGSPYALMGTTPGSMSATKIAAIEPCFSRGSIVSAPEGVFFASPNGLMLAREGDIRNVTINAFTKNKWQDVLDVTTLRATRVGTGYYAFGNIRQEASVFLPTAFEETAFETVDYTFSRDGFIFDSISDRVAVSLLYSEDPTINIMTDTWSGEPFIIRNGKVYWMDISEDSPRETWFWKSMVFQPTIKKNFQAMRVFFENDLGLDVPTGAIRTQDETLPDDALLYVRVKADGRYVFSRELRRSGDLLRLPSGFRADYWQIELEGRVMVYCVEMATSAKELMGV